MFLEFNFREVLFYATNLKYQNFCRPLEPQGILNLIICREIFPRQIIPNGTIQLEQSQPDVTVKNGDYSIQDNHEYNILKQDNSDKIILNKTT